MDAPYPAPFMKRTLFFNTLLAPFFVAAVALGATVESNETVMPRPAHAPEADVPSAPTKTAGESIDSGDYLMPRAGQLGFGAASGIPYVAIGEVTYGFGERFAMGAIAGITPRTVGFGLRPR